MKKIILASVAVVGVLLLAILVYTYVFSRTSDVAITVDRDEAVVMLDRSSVQNLRDIDPATGLEFAHSFVAEIPEYIVAVPDFTLPDSFYPDFIQVEIRSSGASVRAEYTSGSTCPGIGIEMFVFASADTAQRFWLQLILERAALWYIPPAEAYGIVVGDVAVGDESSLHFIRGNVYVRISSGRSTSVVAVAQELDAQIIAALREVARNSVE